MPTQPTRAELLYPPNSNGTFPGDINTYTPIINSYGEVLLRVDTDGYQGDGDSLILLQRNFGSLYGLLILSWGSCSGCDALQACETYHDLNLLIEELEGTIKWFGNLRAAYAYLSDTPNRELSHYFHLPIFPRFLAALAGLSGLASLNGLATTNHATSTTQSPQEAA